MARLTRAQVFDGGDEILIFCCQGIYDDGDEILIFCCQQTLLRIHDSRLERWVPEASYGAQHCRREAK